MSVPWRLCWASTWKPPAASWLVAPCMTDSPTASGGGPACWVCTDVTVTASVTGGPVVVGSTVGATVVGATEVAIGTGAPIDVPDDGALVGAPAMVVDGAVANGSWPGGGRARAIASATDTTGTAVVDAGIVVVVDAAIVVVVGAGG